MICRIGALFCLFTLGFAGWAMADAIAPCTPGAIGQSIIPLKSGLATYCVSDQGWTDTWFVNSSPVAYDPFLDVLSGDDSPNLQFSKLIGGVPARISGFGYLSPIMDRGTLLPSFSTGSPWVPTTAVHYTVGTTEAQSTIHHPAGLDAVITTKLDGYEVIQTFRFTNTGAETLLDLRFADYFNFHPNGSTFPNHFKGTISYDPLAGLMVTGFPDASFIANGNMRGKRVADAHGLALIPDMAADFPISDVYPNNSGPLGPGDVAGALAWDLGDLAPGASADFTMFKQAEPVPEPGTLLLLGSGMIGAAGFVRRKRKKAA